MGDVAGLRWTIAGAVAVFIAGGFTSARAQGIRVAPSVLEATALDRPLVVAQDTLLDPVWVGEVLFESPPVGLEALERLVHHGPPVWDPSSWAWFAWAGGAIVRLDKGRAVVVADGVQGRDLDVRAAHKVAVSREPDNTIVLWRLGSVTEPRRVLLRGSAYFHPRLSPDASYVLVHQSWADGGRLVLISMDGRVRDLGPGSDGSFTPDGLGVVFTVVSGDGRRVVDADLHYLDVSSGVRTRLTWTPNVAEVEPAVSPDGRFIAFVDAVTGRLCVARMPTLSSARGAP